MRVKSSARRSACTARAVASSSASGKAGRASPRSAGLQQTSGAPSGAPCRLQGAPTIAPRQHGRVPMRLKLLRRRLSISAPRMIVRSHLPWPIRWAVVALVLGFSAALALWAFEFGKSIAGLDRRSVDELRQLRVEVAKLRAEREEAQSVANTAQSLLTAEKTV